MRKLVSDRSEKNNIKKSGWKILFNILIILGMMIWTATAVIVAQLVVANLLVLFLGVDKFTQPVWAAIYSAVAYLFALGLTIFLGPRMLATIFVLMRPIKIFQWKKLSKKFGWVDKEEKKYSRASLGLRGWPTWTDIGLAPAGFIIYLILAAILVWIFSLFPWFDAAQEQEIVFNSYLFGFDRIVAFITLVVIAPIAEEIIFRGWLYDKMRQRLNREMSDRWSMLVSIFLVSVLFGMIHMQWNVGVNVFAMSVVLCGLREVTGTIYAGILLHMLKNGVAFYLLYVLGI